MGGGKRDPLFWHASTNSWAPGGIKDGMEGRTQHSSWSQRCFPEFTQNLMGGVNAAYGEQEREGRPRVPIGVKFAERRPRSDRPAEAVTN